MNQDNNISVDYDMHSDQKQWTVVPTEHPSLDNILFGHFFSTAKEAKQYADVLTEQDSNWHLTVMHYNHLLQANH